MPRNIGEDDACNGEFCEHLAAHAAGRADVRAVCDHGKRRKGPLPL